MHGFPVQSAPPNSTTCCVIGSNAIAGLYRCDGESNDVGGALTCPERNEAVRPDRAEAGSDGPRSARPNASPAAHRSPRALTRGIIPPAVRPGKPYRGIEPSAPAGPLRLRLLLGEKIVERALLLGLLAHELFELGTAQVARSAQDVLQALAGVAPQPDPDGRQHRGVLVAQALRHLDLDQGLFGQAEQLLVLAAAGPEPFEL